jgi:hypothetical protein
MTARLCRCCGKPIPKSTVRVVFEPEQNPYHQSYTWWRYAYFGNSPRPQTVAEAQRFVNAGTIVSVKRDETGVRSVGTWDGETYKSKFFCNNNCAIDFAYMLAAAGHQTKAHESAVAKQTPKQEDAA